MLWERPHTRIIMLTVYDNREYVIEALVRMITKKLQIHSVAGLTRYAIARGLIRID